MCGCAFTNANLAIGANFLSGEVGGSVAAFEASAANGFHPGVVGSHRLKVAQRIGVGGEASNNGPLAVGSLLVLEGVVAHIAFPSAGGTVTSDVANHKAFGSVAGGAATRSDVDFDDISLDGPTIGADTTHIGRIVVIAVLTGIEAPVVFFSFV